MGNEMGNNNVSGLQEQEKGEYEAPNEVPNKAGDNNNLKAENQPVTSPREEGFDENDHKESISEDLSGNGGSHIEKQDKIDPDNTKEEVADQSSKALLSAKDASDKDGIVDDTASASKKNLAETTGNEIQDGRELETAEVQSPDDSRNPPLVLDNTSVDEAKSFLLSKDGSSFETHSVYDENQSKTSDEEIQEQIPTEKEPEPEPELEPDTTMIPAPDTDSREEQIQSIPPSKDGSCYETVISPDSDKSISEANDQQTHKETLKEKEGDGEMNSSPEITWTPVNSESASTDQDADQLKPSSMVEAEPALEDGMVLERSDMDILGSTGTHDSEVKENALENESKKEQDGSVFPHNIPEVEKHGNEMQKEETKIQVEELQDNRKNEEIEAGVDVGEIYKTEPDSENGEAKAQVVKLNLDSEVGPDLRNEVVAVSGLLESLQVGDIQSKEKFVVLTDDTNLSENQSSLNVGQEQETKVDDNSKNMTMDHLDPDDYNKVATVEDSDNRSGSLSEEDKELEKETQVLGEVSAHPTDFAVVDTNSEEVKVSASSLSDSIAEEAAPDIEEVQMYLATDGNETEMVKPMSFDFGPIEPDTTHQVLSVETHSQDVTQDLIVVSSEILEDTRNYNFEQKHENVREVDVAKISTSGIINVMLSDSRYGRECDMELCSPESDESYRTAYEQENLSSIVKVEMKPTLNFAEQTVVTEMLVVEVNKKDAKKETETSNTEVKHAIGSSSTESYSTDPKMPDEVPRDERAEVSLQTPLLFEEKKISEDFRTNCFGSEINPSKVGLSIGKPLAETKLPEKEKCDEMLPEDQILEEKQVITMGRNSLEKLNVPLLSFLKDESYCLESEEKKGKSIGKKVNVEKWNSSDDKATGTTRGRGGAKRKPKPLFFNICMCCTTEIP